MAHAIYVVNARPHKHRSVAGRVFFPTVPLYLATILTEAGHSVRFVDRWLEEMSVEQLVADIQQERPAIAIIHFTTKEVPEAVRIAAQSKAVHPDLHVVGVGLHPTMYPTQVVADESFDCAVQGDAEGCICQLVELLLGGSGRVRQGLPPNVWSRLGEPTDSSMLSTAQFVDLNQLPLPNYDLINLNDYVHRDLYFMTGDPTVYRVLKFSASRGCLYKCTFCTEPFKGYQRMSNERIIQHFDHLVKRADPQVMFFDDPEFFLMKEETLKLLDILEERYSFRCISTSRANDYRPDYISKDLMRRFASRWVMWDCGAETGSAHRMRNVQKNITISQLCNVADQAGESGVRAGFSFMSGMPGETEREMLETVFLMEELKRRARGNIFITYQYYQPIGPTVMSLEAIRYGFPAPRSLRDWENVLDPRTGATFVHLHPWIQRPEFLEYLMLVVKYVVNGFHPPEEEELAKIVRRSWEHRKAANNWADLGEVRLSSDMGLSYFTPREVWRYQGPSPSKHR